MTTLARSAESLAVPEIVPVADARMPTYTVEARNSRFMAGSMMSTSKGLVVVAPGVTGPLTLNHGVPVYTVVFRLSKYTANVTLPVPLAFTKSTEPMNRTVSTTDELPRPRDRTVCTGMVSGTPGGSGPTYGSVSALAPLRKLKTSISKITRPSPQPATAAVSATRHSHFARILPPNRSRATSPSRSEEHTSE